MNNIALQIKDLHVQFNTEYGIVNALKGVNLTIHQGEVVGLVGETGSGKSVTARCIMRLLPKTAKITQGEILFGGRDLASASQGEMRRLRGGEIGMIFQEPGAALNPVMRIGDQVTEAIRQHFRNTTARENQTKVLRLLERLGMPDPERIAQSYPYELSGGMQQRAVIAIALSCNPRLLIADEPTSALDVTVQAKILELIRSFEVPILFITHDFGVVAELCDRVSVMHHGIVVEENDIFSIFSSPIHPYTQSLLAAMPQNIPTKSEQMREKGVQIGSQQISSSRWLDSADNILEVRDLVKSYRSKHGVVRAVNKVSFSIKRGETLGLVGESGCGKTTLGKSLIRLLDPDSGEVWFDSKEIANLPQKAFLPFRRSMQIVFQDPFATLNPAMTVYQNVSRGLKIHGLVKNEKETRDKVKKLIEEVGLTDQHIHRFPHQFSGGQRQRIAIARALAVNPDLIVLDEPTSALDVSVQAKILNLFKHLQMNRGFSYLFITHNLIVARHMCHRIGVMYFGYLVELAESEKIFTNPIHPYTKALLSAIPPSTPFDRRERIVLDEDFPNPSEASMQEMEKDHFVRW